ncbi:bifunctional DNA-formamidopyrimidine glycosylase/DNA-(apurinic or apyrimidinic site) lyase [Leucobacter coleopterorum]|uniref:Formamidopyrimidine-DNA glycosylase n=1 Tax=Leucobacter coleopterorum TaxID=2714933 RepID=A0ABX6K048_9MICO|nr:bifunctional DNA-formamidopyrimidine glycosylase/DNA-(apurinic or apyrimidinic site) lyase [Leucobacter coleopterorum]QIM18607.1 bifunctional DNA-formamidopyrimidine glycosylase/DNA-(apurinic or apyrimidinic site) lyase [Leucobacter coleopterorum]
MPELPEVEVVRAGLAPALTGATVTGVEVLDPRALKRHVPVGGSASDGGHGVTLDAAEGVRRAADFERRVTGLRLLAPRRRGKFLWVPVDGDDRSEPRALLAHLGMSGQMLLRALDAPDDRFVRIRLWIEHPEHGELRLDFADQRLFGSLALDDLIVDGGEPASLPAQASHIARDPLDPLFDDALFVESLLRRSTAVKRALLDQRLLSGVGNIYADEALWAARIHPETAGSALSERNALGLLAELRAVFTKALAEGGTSFDEQYVNVNGQAGYFSRSLHVYGREGEQCHRCRAVIKRIPFGGRSSHFCPRCQRLH